MGMGAAFKNVEAFLHSQAMPPRHAGALDHKRNGIAEGKQRTAPNMLRPTLFANKHVPYQFWPIVFGQMVLIDNTPPSKALHWKSPYEVLPQGGPPYTLINMLYPAGKIYKGLPSPWGSLLASCSNHFSPKRVFASKSSR